MSFSAAFPDKYPDLSASGLPSGYDAFQYERKPDQLYGADLYPSHVDEFFAPHHGMADSFREKRSDQSDPLLFPSAFHTDHQHTGTIILGMVYNFLPFMVLPLYNVLSKIDRDIILAARDLGATPVYTFRKIIFPLSLPGVISGITMVFVPALTTFVISDLLGGSKILLIGNVIDRQFQQGSNWHVGSGLSLVLMVFILISMFLTGKYDKNGEGGMF